METRARRLERKAAGMSVLVVLQALACTFFLVDVVGDLAAEGLGLHLATEAFAVFGLLVAVVLGAFQAREYIAAARRDEAAVAAAQGALSELIRMRFGAWRLTPAESDVALFALKGCDVSEIARLRGSAAGTVRAQLARVYSKAGVDSHSALIALFLEELIDLPEHLHPADQA
jgi:DNA-binding CsgD family transcriptional regulator